MPSVGRRSKRKDPVSASASTTPILTEERDVETVTNATTADQQTALPFTVDVQPMPEGYKPDRSPAGRTRTPSVFDELLPGYKGAGWQKQPHDGNVVLGEDGKATPESVKASNAHVIKRELQKAQHWLRLGMDIQITTTDVEFNVRDLQKRKAKEGEVADADGNVVDDPSNDVDPDEDD